LVVIQLSGGNDGLNTVVPYGCGHYYDKRPTLSIPPDDLITINGTLGLHPSLTGLSELHKRGQLAIVLGAGYQNSSRSHCRSTDIWQTAKPTTLSTTGWLGRLLAELDHPSGLKSSFPSAVYLENSCPMTLAGSAPLGILPKGAAQAAPAGPGEQPRLIAYPPNSFAQKIALVSQMIIAGYDTRVYFLSLTGFDTHTNQKLVHNDLLQQLSVGISTFQTNLQHHGLANNVLTITFSEFGRRLAENPEYGTDHGAAAPHFVIGGAIDGGLYGQYPNLNQLESADLKPTVDFRAIYATIIERWFGADSRSILGERFDLLAFV
jgi:uncharacterized protein (DUF1501 family)